MTCDGNSENHVAYFFKFIFELRLDLQKLVIPRKFMKTHGKNLSNVIHLYIPPGKVWEFNLIKENDKTFLQKGWPEFVEFYSLNDKHCLMFKYNGNSQFDVIVFDPSASEIDYPFDDEPNRDNKTSINISKPSSSSKKVFSKSKNKTMQSVTFGKLILSYNRKYSAFTPEESNRVRAYYANHCNNHPSFATKMYPSFVKVRFSMGITKTFETKFLRKERYPGTFNLQTDTGKSWEVKIYARNCIRTNMKLKGAGWKKFVLGNRLKVGDICIFELIDKKEFKVHIIRASIAKEKPENTPSIIVEVD